MSVCAAIAEKTANGEVALPRGQAEGRGAIHRRRIHVTIALINQPLHNIEMPVASSPVQGRSSVVPTPAPLRLCRIYSALVNKIAAELYRMNGVQGIVIGISKMVVVLWH